MIWPSRSKKMILKIGHRAQPLEMNFDKNMLPVVLEKGTQAADGRHGRRDSKWIKLWHPGMDGRPLEALVIYL